MTTNKRHNNKICNRQQITECTIPYECAIFGAEKQSATKQLSNY